MHDGYMSTPTVPVLTVCSLDPVLRGSACAGLLFDLPGALVVQHDLVPVGPDGASLLRRTVFDVTGCVESAEVEVGHGCLSCALREDVLPTLFRLAGRRRGALVLALPVAAEPLPVIRALIEAPRRSGVRLRPAAVVTALDGAALEEDLLGDATLRERGLELSAVDDRGVGEVLGHQLEYGDAALVPDALDPRAARLLQHLRMPGGPVDVVPLHDADVAGLLAVTRPSADPRGDLLRALPSGLPDGDGVWTVELASDRPLSPYRLLERVEDLGRGRTRARGHFQVHTRPGHACAWDGAGGHLSIGTIGPWPAGRRPATRLVVTGTDGAHGARTPEELREVFDQVLLDDDEAARGPAWWAGRPDGLDPWLGDLTDCA